MEAILAILFLVLALVGFSLAGVQTFQLINSRKAHQLLVWKIIRAIRTQLVLSEASKRVEEKDPDVYSAYRVNMELYRDLLAQAVSLERGFGPATLLRWYQVGKLGSRFELEQACHFLKTRQIDIQSEEVQRLSQLLGRETMREVREKGPDYITNTPAQGDFR